MSGEWFILIGLGMGVIAAFLVLGPSRRTDHEAPQPSSRHQVRRIARHTQRLILMDAMARAMHEQQFQQPRRNDHE